MRHKFIDLKLNYNNLDIYYHRNSIQNFIAKNINLFSGICLDIGSGEMPYRSFIKSNSDLILYLGVDLKNDYSKTRPNIYWDGSRLPILNNSIDCVILTEVLEHCPDGYLVIQQIYDCLKKGGTLIFTVPFLWPLHDAPYDEFRYTPFSLERILNKAGFANVKLEALGGWDASLAQMIGLWLKRSGLGKYQRRILPRIFLPFIKYLISKEIKPQNIKKDQLMITGIGGIAIK